jgi:hypothetical protein
MANEQNLQKIQSTNEAREKGRNGGIASGKSRRRIKSFKDSVSALLDCSAGIENTNEILQQFPELDDIFIDWRSVIIYKQIVQALQGNTRAFEALRNTVGEEPAKKKPIAESHKLTDEQMREFDKVMGLVDSTDFTEEEADRIINDPEAFAALQIDKNGRVYMPDKK